MQVVTSQAPEAHNHIHIIANGAIKNYYNINHITPQLTCSTPFIGKLTNKYCHKKTKRNYRDATFTKVILVIRSKINCIYI